MITRITKVSKELKNIVDEYAGTVYNTHAFLVGKNSDDILKALVKISTDKNWGCGYMPRIKTTDLTETYIQLAKENLTPCGIIIISGTYRSGIAVNDPRGRRNGFGDILWCAGGHESKIYVKENKKWYITKMEII